MASPTLLIDGDILLYQAVSACRNEIVWEERYAVTIYADLHEIEFLMDTMVRNWADKLDAEAAVICLSDYTNPFRKELDDTYKENRTGMGRPVGYYPALERMEKDYAVRRFPRCEADDVMGILATSGLYDRPIIVSDDKDLRQIPGELYIPRTGEHLKISPRMGHEYHMLQTLVGDPTDNYPGCPGIGQVRAQRIIDQNEDIWPAVVTAFAKAKKTVNDAILQARLAKILQAENFNMKTEEITLWEPANTAGASITTATQAPLTKTVPPKTVSSNEPSRGSLRHKTSLR